MTVKNQLTRRNFLTRVAAAGGSVPLVYSMEAMGLINLSDTAEAHGLSDDDVNPNIGKGKKVAIIGAGLSGLTAAYELSRRGFECMLFEADDRPKGRTFTVRPDGSPDSWYQEVGREPEYCSFDEVDGPGSLYFEAGAGRIPSHHRTVLNYCKKFGVKLESYIFASRANLVRSDKFNGGNPVSVRRFKHNLRGYLAEMFRTMNPNVLDKNLTPKDIEILRSKLDDLSVTFGELDDQYKYAAKEAPTRAGYSVEPGAGNQPGETWKPFALNDLLNAEEIWKNQVYNDMRYYWQTSLMQPVGGIDRIADAFLRQATPGGKRLGNLIELNRKVVQVEVSENGVKVWHERVDHLGRKFGANGGGQFDADFCISTIAPSLLSKVSNNFDETFSCALIKGVSNVPACKVAWQSERFWESDSDQIYGGISWTSDAISQIWYPSTGFHNKRGILTGAYLRGDPAKTFGALSREDRIAQALQQGVKLHTELGDPKVNQTGKAMTIAWQNMPFQAGGWFDYTEDQRKNGYQTMLKGQKDRFFMAGDAMSYTPGWMEGALGAGRLAVSNIEKLVKQG
jgi:monoamine oxidase